MPCCRLGIMNTTTLHEKFASAVGLRLESRKENLTLLKDAYEYAKIVTRRGRAVGLP